MIRRALLAGIGLYSRAISPALPPRCRFYPTCSAYAAEAVDRHGAARGTWLALRRLVLCAPWHPGGVDLVPAADPPGADPPGAVLPGAGMHPGTAQVSHSSGTAGAPARADAARRPHRATPPDLRRANEESSVA